MSSFFTMDINTTTLKDFDRLTELQVLTKIKQDAIEQLDGCEGFAWRFELLECNSILDLLKQWGVEVDQNKQLVEYDSIYNSRLVDIIFMNLAPLLTDGEIMLYNWDYDYGNKYIYQNGQCEYKYLDFERVCVNE